MLRRRLLRLKTSLKTRRTCPLGVFQPGSGQGQ